MATTSVSSMQQATCKSGDVVTKERLVSLFNEEIMEDAASVEDYSELVMVLDDDVVIAANQASSNLAKDIYNQHQKDFAEQLGSSHGMDGNNGAPPPPTTPPFDLDDNMENIAYFDDDHDAPPRRSPHPFDLDNINNIVDNLIDAPIPTDLYHIDDLIANNYHTLIDVDQDAPIPTDQAPSIASHSNVHANILGVRPMTVFGGTGPSELANGRYVDGASELVMGSTDGQVMRQQAFVTPAATTQVGASTTQAQITQKGPLTPLKVKPYMFMTEVEAAHNLGALKKFGWLRWIRMKGTHPMIKISSKVNDDHPPVFRIPRETNLQGLTETLHKRFTMAPGSYHLWYNFFGHYVPLRIEKQLLTCFFAYHVYRMPHIELLLREKDGAPPPLFDLEDINDLKDIDENTLNRCIAQLQQVTDNPDAPITTDHHIHSQNKPATLESQ
nr:hypothetical protein [Tanacetum cinerariifolium]